MPLSLWQDRGTQRKLSEDDARFRAQGSWPFFILTKLKSTSPLGEKQDKPMKTNSVIAFLDLAETHHRRLPWLFRTQDGWGLDAHKLRSWINELGQAKGIDVIKLLPELVTLKELSARIGLTTGQLRERCDRGQVPGAYKVGKKWLVDVQRFNVYLRECEQPFLPTKRDEQGRFAGGQS